MTTSRIPSWRLLLLGRLLPLVAAASCAGGGTHAGVSATMDGGPQSAVDGSVGTEGGLPNGCAKLEIVTCESTFLQPKVASGVPADNGYCSAFTCPDGQCCPPGYPTCAAFGALTAGGQTEACYPAAAESCGDPASPDAYCPQARECLSDGCCEGTVCGHCDSAGKPIDPCQCVPKSFAELCGNGTLCPAEDNCGQPSNCFCNAGTCEDGVCACPNGGTMCGDYFGGCKDAQTDPNNCGGCGNASSGDPPNEHVCPGPQPSCVGGCCAGTTSCGGSCVDMTTDSKNCGACGNVCPNGEACDNGSCLCAATGESCASVGCCGAGLCNASGHCQDPAPCSSFSWAAGPRDPSSGACLNGPSTCATWQTGLCSRLGSTGTLQSCTDSGNPCGGGTAVCCGGTVTGGTAGCTLIEAQADNGWAGCDSPTCATPNLRAAVGNPGGTFQSCTSLYPGESCTGVSVVCCGGTISAPAVPDLSACKTITTIYSREGASNTCPGPGPGDCVRVSPSSVACPASTPTPKACVDVPANPASGLCKGISVTCCP
jgi:hypothetical protein